MPYKFNEPRRHKIPRARYRVQNWPAYDRALQQRGSLTVWVTPEALAAWRPPRTGQRGRPRDYSEVAIETGHLLRLAFGRPWRQTEGLLRSVTVLLGLEVGVPDHTTFARRSPGLTLATALARAQASGGPVDVVIDATGLKVHGAGEWLAERHGGRGTRGWRKLHLAVDPGGGEILACELTGNEEGDASQVGPLLEQIPGPIASVIADGAYDGEPVYRAVAERQSDPPAAVIIPPRATAVPSAAAGTAPSQRDRHVQLIRDKGRMGWQRAVDYGRRSLGETAMSRYKALIGPSLRARTLPAHVGSVEIRPHTRWLGASGSASSGAGRAPCSDRRRPGPPRASGSRRSAQRSAPRASCRRARCAGGAGCRRSATPRAAGRARAGSSRSTAAQNSSRAVRWTRSTLPFRCGERGRMGRDLMRRSRRRSWTS